MGAQGAGGPGHPPGGLPLSHAHLAAAAGLPPMPGGAPLLGFPPGALPPSVSGAGPHPPPPGHPGLPLPHPLSIKSEPRDEHGANKHSEDLRNASRNSISPMEQRERERERESRERDRENRMRMRSPPSESEGHDSHKRRKEEISKQNAHVRDGGDVS